MMQLQCTELMQTLQKKLIVSFPSQNGELECVLPVVAREGHVTDWWRHPKIQTRVGGQTLFSSSVQLISSAS